MEKTEEFFEEKKLPNDIYSNALLAFFFNTKSKVLLVGEVQSGKTRMIIEYINYSITSNECAKFDIIIIFGGTTNSLNYQTENRLKGKDGLKTKINSFKKFDYIYSESINGDSLVVYIGAKIDYELNRIVKTIMDIPNLNDKKVLIIDDECDYGSINTSTMNESKYYNQINKIFSKIKYGGILSITATPFANLLNNKSKFFYNHLVSLPKMSKKGYCGISFFSKFNNFYIDYKEFSNILLNTKSKQFNDYYYTFCIYLINTIIKKESINSDESDMLINSTYAKNKNKNNKSNHNDIYNLMKEILELSKNNIVTLKKNINYILKNILKKEVNININCLKNVLENIVILIINSDSKNESKSTKTIYIGGILLSRGITYENLTTEFIINFPKKDISVDTLLQMCRWFGYRGEKSNQWMNVITSEKGIEALIESEKYNEIFFKKEHGGELNISEIRNKLLNLNKNSIIVKGCSNAKNK